MPNPRSKNRPDTARWVPPSVQSRVEGQSSLFLKGPIPVVWFETLRRQTSSANTLATGLVLWLAHGIVGSEFQVRRAWLKRFQISPRAFRRSLRDLERWGLVAVQQVVGKRSIVRIRIPGKAGDG